MTLLGLAGVRPAGAATTDTTTSGAVGPHVLQDVSYGTVTRRTVVDVATAPATTGAQHPRLVRSDTASLSTATGTSRLRVAAPDPTVPLVEGAPDAVWTLDRQIGAFGGGQFVEPPDTQLAVGPSNLVEAVNMTMSVWSKTGRLLSDKDLDVVFGVPSGYSFSDPHVQWDGRVGRWFMSGMSFDASNDGQVYLAVSATGDPTGNWTVYTLASDTSGELMDQPKLGLSDDKVAVAWDDFNSAQTWLGSETKIIQASDLLAGAASPAVAEWKAAPDNNQWSVVPAQSLSPTTTQYLAFSNADGVTSPTLNVIAVTGTPAGHDVAFTETDVPVAATNVPPQADQPGQAASIDTGDDRLQSAVWENGVLWTGGNDGCQPAGDTAERACLRLDQVSTSGSAPALLQDFDAGVAGEGLYYPGISMNAAGDMFVGFSFSSPTLYGSAGAAGQRAGATAGTLSSLVTVAAGTAIYDATGCGGRWGDYSGAAPDPSAPGQVWVTDEYAIPGTSARGTTTCEWATATAPVSFGPAAASINPATGPQAGGTAVTISGSDLFGATEVDFGSGNPAPAPPLVSADGTSLVVTSPPAASPSAVTLAVLTPSGTASAGQFTYEAPVSGGGTSAGGGTAPGGGTSAGGGAVGGGGTFGGGGPVGGGGTFSGGGGGGGTGGTSAGGGGGSSGGGSGSGANPPAGTKDAASGSSSDSSGLASAASRDAVSGLLVAATASGQGTLGVAQYPDDPVGPPSFSSAGVYVDVQAAADSTFNSLTGEVCGMGAGNALQWWDPTAAGGGGAWTQMSNQTFTPGPPACITFTVNASSSPNLQQLGGTVVGVAKTAASPRRVAGADREATAVAISQAGFGDKGAGAVVLARADDYPDALTGAALAVAKNGPVLLTSGPQLDPATAVELTRVLAPGGTVYLLGGPAALSDQVAAAVTALGYTTVRYGGADRFATAAAVDRSLGAATTILLADGQSFADALSASAATGTAGTVVALTAGRSLPQATSELLAASPGAKVYAIGGPAAAADPGAAAIVGADRFDTSALVAQRLFGAPAEAGIATGLNFPDALAAGPWLARLHAPLLLAEPTGLPAAVQSYLSGVASGLAQVELYGGQSALGVAVETGVENAAASR